jgi:hypothetical protein
MNTLKAALKSRTVLFALVVALLSVLQGFVGLLPIGPFSQMCIGLVIAFMVVILRFVTTTPIGEK